MMSNDLSRQLCELCGIDKAVDFTKPENFARLWEVVNKQTKEELIGRITGRILVEAGDYIYELKQSIREAEWVYE